MKTARVARFTVLLAGALAVDVAAFWWHFLHVPRSQRPRTPVEL